MGKSLLVVMAFVLCAVSVNAQLKQLDDFQNYWGFDEKITTELIECNPSSNVYTKINIYRNYGVPRYGVITDCSQNVDTVWYIPSVYDRSISGGINAPKMTDTSLTVWWAGSYFIVNIMDVLTGDVVLKETHSGQAPSLFGETITTFQYLDSNVVGGISTVDFGGGFQPKNSSNPGTTIDYSYLPDGLYWIYIVDRNNIIWYMKTIRKGI